MGIGIVSRRTSRLIAIAVAVCCLLSVSAAFASVTRYDAPGPDVVTTGVWTIGVNSIHWGGSQIYSSDVNATATINFTGTGIDWGGSKGPNRGIAELLLDGVSIGTFDLYSPTVDPQLILHSVRDLPNGPHSLTVRPTGTWNPLASSPRHVTVDFFDVYVEPPVVSTSASSRWSLALVTLVGLLGAARLVRRTTPAGW